MAHTRSAGSREQREQKVRALFEENLADCNKQEEQEGKACRQMWGGGDAEDSKRCSAEAGVMTPWL